MAKKKTKPAVKQMVIKLTSTGVTVVSKHEFDPLSKLPALVKALSEDWAKTHARVKESNSPIAHAFAEVYNPAYDDEASGDLTIALDKVFAPTVKVKPIPAKPSKVAAVAAKPKAKPTKAATGKVKVSKAEQVREMIRANPKSDVDTLIVMAVDTLDMTQGKAKVYVKENVIRVRG